MHPRETVAPRMNELGRFEETVRRPCVDEHTLRRTDLLPPAEKTQDEIGWTRQELGHVVFAHTSNKLRILLRGYAIARSREPGTELRRQLVFFTSRGLGASISR